MEKVNEMGGSYHAASGSNASAPAECMERAWQALENVANAVGFGPIVAMLIWEGASIARSSTDGVHTSFVFDVDGWLAERLGSHCVGVHRTVFADGTCQVTVEC